MTATDEKTGVSVHTEHHDHHHHRVLEPVPIEQEAVEDAVHVKLGWRSWVWRQKPFPLNTGSRLLTCLMRSAGCVYNMLCSLCSGTSPLLDTCCLSEQVSLTLDKVFVVVAAGSVIAFIIRDLGDASLAGWIIQVRDAHADYV